MGLFSKFRKAWDAAFGPMPPLRSMRKAVPGLRP